MNRKYTIAAALAGLALVLTACGSSGSSADSDKTTSSSGAAGTTASGAGEITIGSAGFTENVLLADIYADALSAKGVKVTKKLNIGERPIYIKALQDGDIDFIPEYSGSLLSYFDPKATAKTSADVDAALPAAIGDKLTVYKYAEAQDSDTISVTAATAKKYSLTSISDLAPVAGKLTFGAPAQFKTRADGLPALKSVYGVTFGHFTELKAGGSFTIEALKNGSVDAGDIFSTDASIAANNFVVLKDDKNMFAAQNIIPLVSKSKSTSTIEQTCNAVSAKLDTVTLAALVAKVGTDDPDKVAKEWLTSEGLI